MLHIAPLTCMQFRHADVSHLDREEPLFQRMRDGKRYIFLEDDDVVGVRTIVAISKTQRGVTTRCERCIMQKLALGPILVMKAPTDWHPMSAGQRTHLERRRVRTPDGRVVQIKRRVPFHILYRCIGVRALEQRDPTPTRKPKLLTIKSKTGHPRSLDIPCIQRSMEHRQMVLLVAKIDVDERVCEEHPHIVEARSTHIRDAALRTRDGQPRLPRVRRRCPCASRICWHPYQCSGQIAGRRWSCGPAQAGARTLASCEG